MMGPRLLAMTIALAFLAGCGTVGPDYARPESAAIRKAGAAAGFHGKDRPEFSDQPVPSRWWHLYESPELDALVSDALAANTDLRVAAANLARAQAGLSYAVAASGPSTGIQAGAAYARPSAEEVLRPGRPLPNAEVYALGASVSYQVDLFGQIRRTIEAARADVAAAQAAHDAVRVTVVAETSRAYLDACALARELSVAERLVATQSESTRLTRRLLQFGRGTSIDVERSSSQEDQVRASVPPLVAQRQGALYRLAALTGRTPSEIPVSAGSCQEEPHLSSPLPVGDGAALLKRRPDIRRAEAELRAATSRIGVATADLYPKVVLGAAFGSAGLTRNFGASDTLKFSLGPLISWEFPNRSRVRPRIEAAEADAQAALARFDGTVLAALKETESALETYSRDLERRALLARARDNAVHAARDSERLFVNGRSGYLPVLDATRTAVAAEQALSAAETRLAADQVNLFLALGGGWQAAD